MMYSIPMANKSVSSPGMAMAELVCRVYQRLAVESMSEKPTADEEAVIKDMIETVESIGLQFVLRVEWEGDSAIKGVLMTDFPEGDNVSDVALMRSTK